MYIYICIYIYLCIFIYIYIYTYINTYLYIPIGDLGPEAASPWGPHIAEATYNCVDVDDDEDVYLRLQHRKWYHNLVNMSYVKHINPASKA
jgi:hypothetical protein